jgi:hypothetical protein
MAGFLDRKNRLIDFKLTHDGKSQLSNGNDLRFKYYTFSDSSIVYHENHDSLKDEKISNSEEFFLPFENDSEVSVKANPELYLDGKVSYDNRDVNIVFKNNATNISLSDFLIQKKYLDKKSFNIIESNEILFSSKEEFSSFDFVSEINVRNYPTIKYLSEDISNLDEMLYDKRFLGKIRFKTLVPINTDGSQVDIEQKETKENFNVNFLFKTFDDPRLNLLESDSKNESINKVLNALENNTKVFFQRYNINQDFQKQEDAYIFELHEVLNDSNLDKLVFIRLDDIIDPSSGRQRSIYLIGKIILTRKITDSVNAENRQFIYNVDNDYCFISMFTMVVE